MTIYQTPSSPGGKGHLKKAIARVQTRPRLTLLVLVSIDLLCLSLAGIASVWLRLLFDGQFSPSIYWRLWPITGVFIVGYALASLYPGIAMSPVEELRRLTLTNTLLCLLMGSSIFLFREVELYSRAAFFDGLAAVYGVCNRWALRHPLALCTSALVGLSSRRDGRWQNGEKWSCGRFSTIRALG